MVGMYLKKSN